MFREHLHHTQQFPHFSQNSACRHNLLFIADEVQSGYEDQEWPKCTWNSWPIQLDLAIAILHHLDGLGSISLWVPWSVSVYRQSRCESPKPHSDIFSPRLAPQVRPNWSHVCGGPQQCSGAQNSGMMMWLGVVGVWPRRFVNTSGCRWFAEIPQTQGNTRKDEVRTNVQPEMRIQMNPNGSKWVALCCGALPQRWKIHYCTMLAAVGDELSWGFSRYLSLCQRPLCWWTIEINWNQLKSIEINWNVLCRLL